RAAEKAEEAKLRSKEAYDDALDKANDWLDVARDYVREKPVQSIAMAVAAGWLAGRILREENIDGGADRAARPKLAMPDWIDDVRRLGVGLKNLFGAQLKLAMAEVGLARSGIVMMLFMGLAAIVFAVALGFTLLALAGWGLAQWFGSWAWALTALAGIQLILLVLSILVFRRGMHWLTLPATRAELALLAKEAAIRGKAEGERAEGEGGYEHPLTVLGLAAGSGFLLSNVNINPLSVPGVSSLVAGGGADLVGKVISIAASSILGDFAGDGADAAPDSP
ncbi:hypothetical protein KCV01_g24215, partial [Aureobasidium melanogenum]